jgi:hypothetical protein
MPLWLRLLTWTSGAVLGLAVVELVFPLVGWTGEVTHAGLARSCVIFMGSTPIAPAVESNTPTCPREPIDWSDYLLGLTMLAIGAAIAGVAFAMERRAGKARTS